MANNKTFKIKNGLSAVRYLGSNGTETAGTNGPFGVFSTTLYEGTAAAQTITNNINLSTDGGMVWSKNRDGTDEPTIMDTVIGTGFYGNTNANSAYLGSSSAYITAFNTNGYALGSANQLNRSGDSFVSWTFKKQAKFFDVVTYTGDGTTRNISHNLGTTPGMIIVKKTNTSGTDWAVYHRGIDSSSPEGYHIRLNTTAARQASTFTWGNTAPTNTTFTVGNSGLTNNNSDTYVAYLFAHDTSDDGYIQCGSYTGNGTYLGGPDINLGWTPQWLLIKRSSDTESWRIADNLRGIAAGTAGAYLSANLDNVEAGSFGAELNSTGFKITSNNNDLNANGSDYIYIAIRGEVSTQTLDLSTGHTFSITPTEALDILFSNPPASGNATGFSVEVNNTGGYALTWPSSVKWHLGTAPTATASKELYTFVTTDGGTTYYGKLAGSNIA